MADKQKLKKPELQIRIWISTGIPLDLDDVLVKLEAPAQGLFRRSQPNAWSDMGRMSLKKNPGPPFFNWYWRSSTTLSSSC